MVVGLQQPNQIWAGDKWTITMEIGVREIQAQVGLPLPCREITMEAGNRQRKRMQMLGGEPRLAIQILDLEEIDIVTMKIAILATAIKATRAEIMGIEATDNLGTGRPQVEGGDPLVLKIEEVFASIMRMAAV